MTLLFGDAEEEEEKHLVPVTIFNEINTIIQDQKCNTIIMDFLYTVEAAILSLSNLMNKTFALEYSFEPS